MLSDVHEGLDCPSEIVDSATIRGKYEFYHYNVDGTDDRVSVSVQTSGEDLTIYCSFVFSGTGFGL